MLTLQDEFNIVDTINISPVSLALAATAQNLLERLETSLGVDKGCYYVKRMERGKRSVKEMLSHMGKEEYFGNKRKIF